MSDVLEAAGKKQKAEIRAVSKRPDPAFSQCDFSIQKAMIKVACEGLFGVGSTDKTARFCSTSKWLTL